MIAVYFKTLFADWQKEISTFHWLNLQSRRAMSAALACILALFLALLLHVDNPFWAVISAAVISQAEVESTFYRSVLRLIGTFSGAVIALICIYFFADRHIWYLLSIYIIAFVGIFLSEIDRSRSYAWLLFYMTVLIVMVAGMADPTASGYFRLAFYRAFEVSLGVMSAWVVMALLYPTWSRANVVKKMKASYRYTMLLFDMYFKSLLAEETFQAESFEKLMSVLVPLLDEQEALLKYARFREMVLHKEEVLPLQLFAKSMRHLAELIIPQVRNLLLNSPSLAFVSLFKDELNALHEAYHAFFACGRALLKRTSSVEELQQAINGIEIAWESLKQRYATLRAEEKNLKYSLEEVGALFQLTLPLKLAPMLFKEYMEKHSKPKKFRLREHSWAWRLKHYDAFYLKHAMVGAAALLFVPLFWMFFNLPGFQQVAISIAACIGMQPGVTRVKGFSRFFGAILGFVFVVIALGLNIQSLPFYLLVIFFVTSVGMYFWHSATSLNYVALQALLVFFVGMAGDLSPSTSLLLPMERVLGICLGVLSMVVFQHVLWRFRANEQLRHGLRQVKRHIYPLTYAFADCLSEGAMKGLANVKTFEQLKQSMRELQNLQDVSRPELTELAQTFYYNYRAIYHDLYFLLLLQSQLSSLTAIQRELPDIPTLAHKLSVIMSHIYDDHKKVVVALEALQAIKERLMQLRRDMRTKAIFFGKDETLVFESIVLLGMLMQLCDCQERVLSAHEILLANAQT